MFSRLSYKKQQTILIVLFLLIPLALLFVFSYLPLANMLRYSVNEWNGYSKTMKYVGIKNYVELFTRPELFSVFKVSLYYFGGSIVQIVLALYFAVILSDKIKGKNFFKGVLFFPYLMNGVAISFIFLYFFRPDGTLDSFLRLIGAEGLIQTWLRNPHIINYSLAGVSVWRYMGYAFVLFMGAIQSITSEFYEAAEIDGANKWQQFRYIIFPSILKIVELNMILAISGSISVFEIPYVMTRGGNGSMTFVIQTVDMAFKNQKFGLASAMATVLLVIVIIITLIQKGLFKDKEEAI
ncbi:MAG: sugar ABC transporter permease [Ruminiclostridium sp.]|nr:sugar ABC transporter permease [Ruminiclostridium sp.]